MLALRRVFFDGEQPPELVLLHCVVASESTPETVAARSSVVVPPSGEPGRREVRLYLPEAPPGDRIGLRYSFSTVRAGVEWFSPWYTVTLPGEAPDADIARIEEDGGGNLRPAPGLGTFRVALPLREEEPTEGTARFGFGAMRKKPSLDLCRAQVEMRGGRAPVVEIPEALSVLKKRPMPYFLYHVTHGGTGLLADKITCARVTFRDEAGDAVDARVLWSGPSWTAPNFGVLETRNFPSPHLQAAHYFFADEREAFLRSRSAILAATPVPRTFEGFVYGPSATVVEYCFRVLRLGADGSPSLSWAGASAGGNFRVTL